MHSKSENAASPQQGSERSNQVTSSKQDESFKRSQDSRAKRASSQQSDTSMKQTMRLITNDSKLLLFNTKVVPVSKWSTKFFGSEKAVEEEHRKAVDAGCFVIHPFSGFRFTWDFFSSLLVIANIIYIPIDIAFTTNRHAFGGLLFRMISDIWFLIDIIINFRTGYVVADSVVVVLDTRKIETHYLKTWFVIDFIASFPFDFLATNGLQLDSSIKLVQFLRIGKLLSFIRVFRISSLLRSMHRWEEVFNLQYDIAVSFFHLLNLSMVLLLACHFNGCLLYFVPLIYNFPEDSWVAIRNLHGRNVSVAEAYIWSIFKSTSNMLSIGYGQIIPQGITDLWVTIWSQSSGGILFVMFIGYAINLVEEKDITSNAYKTKMTQVREYLSFHHVSTELKSKVSDFFDARYGGKLFDEAQILDELNTNLRKEVVLYNTATLIQSNSLFYDTSDDFIYEIGKRMRFTIYIMQDLIIKVGRKANSVYFIQHGVVRISSPIEQEHQDLCDGMYFGDSCLLTPDLLRSIDAQALTTVHLYYLTKKDFFQVLMEFPEEEKKIMNRIMELRSKKLTDTSRSKMVLTLRTHDSTDENFLGFLEET